MIPEPLIPLAALPHFIGWQIIDNAKLPISPITGAVINAHDRAHWTDANTVISAGYRPAFVFSDSDPFFFLDIDHCLTDRGTWEDEAIRIVSLLPGAAVEVSQSGTGLHIFGRYSEIPPHRCKNIPAGLELYHTGRFVALTGTSAVGSADTDLTAALPGIIAEYFPPSPVSEDGLAEWTDKPVEGWSGPTDDMELIAKALRSRSAAAIFGTSAPFKALWRGDEDALAKAYPDQSGDRPFDGSSADAALMQHLAFWTGKNCARMLRLAEGSALRREKWDRIDYMHRTILGAVARQVEVYQGRRDTAITEIQAPSAPVQAASTAIAPVAATAQLVTGYQYLTAELQAQYFQGCVYVQSRHQILTPAGDFLKPEAFNSTYGGYVFQLDDTGKKTTRKAWEAFVESQVLRFPKVQDARFKPSVAPGAIFTEEGRTAVNSYVPVAVDMEPGDPEPFLKHLRAILPDERDQSILLAYMAACVQHIGVKFQWAPLLQGTEGNGKTLFTHCVAAAVGRRYTHYPQAADIDNKFNGWLLNKLFIGVEDIYVPDHRREVIEALKPMITGSYIEIQGKGADQVTADVCANFMLNTNCRVSGLQTRNGRRFSVFLTAQQTAEDLRRDGMIGDYFPNLYAWLRGGGYAIVSHYLATYQIPYDLNPAGGCHRAPDTSSTGQALAESLGPVEQEILEAVEESRIGFAGGWVSSVALERLLRSMRMERVIPPNRRRRLMQEIGYDWHPALPGGRVSAPVVIDDGKKPRLYIKRGHRAEGVDVASEVLATYLRDQGAA